MARKTVGYREMMWTCPNCGAKNPGTSRICKSCGSAMAEDVQFEQQINGAVQTDERVVEQAKRGADIYCAYCGTRNPAGASTCCRCGADLSEGKERAHGQEYVVRKEEKTENGEAKTIVCSVCGTENPVGALKCLGCGSPLAEATQKTVAREVPQNQEQPQKRGCSRGCLFIVLAVILIGVLGMLLFSGGGSSVSTGSGSVYDFGGGNSGGYTNQQSGPVYAQVTELNWETSAPVMGYVQSSGSAWEDSVPSNAQDVRCREKLRNTYDDEVPGSREVCGEVYSVDLGNGYEEMVQDCVYEVYDNYCNYTVSKWGQVGTKTNSGTGKNPKSPVVSSEYELGEQSVRLSVVLEDENGRTYSVSPSSLSEYRSYDIGDEFVLDVNNRGRVTGMERR